jgi:hypothetical protein
MHLPAVHCDIRHQAEVAAVGFEHHLDSAENRAILAQGSAESGAPTLANLSIPPELAALIDAWPRLPEPIKAGILALVRAAGA